VAFNYYEPFFEVKRKYNLDIYPSEDIKIAMVFSKMGLEEQSKQLLSEFKEYAENDQSIYKNLNLATYYSYIGETEMALDNLEVFAQQDNYHYWILLFLEMDPAMDTIKDLPRFKKIFSDLEKKFWDYHHRVEETLEEESLL
jgi:hypothetical protein